jgi:hypothetical protein
VTDGIEKVSLAEADATVEEEWVVAVRGLVGHRLSSRVGQLVRASDHERVESVARIKLAGNSRNSVVADREEDLAEGVPELGDRPVYERSIGVL